MKRLDILRNSISGIGKCLLNKSNISALNNQSLRLQNGTSNTHLNSSREVDIQSEPFFQHWIFRCTIPNDISLRNGDSIGQFEELKRLFFYVQGSSTGALILGTDEFDGCTLRKKTGYLKLVRAGELCSWLADGLGCGDGNRKGRWGGERVRMGRGVRVEDWEDGGGRGGHFQVGDDGQVVVISLDCDGRQSRGTEQRDRDGDRDKMLWYTQYCNAQVV